MPAPRVRDLETAHKFLELRQKLFKQDVAKLAERLYDGGLSIKQWHAEMKQAVKDLHITSLVTSRGGEWGTITFSEWGRVGRELRDQYAYLRNYAQQIEQRVHMDAMGVDNAYSLKYLQMRSALYSGNSNATFWRGVTYNLLPQVPGDGQTECLMNCGCRLRIEPGDNPNTLHVYWIVNPMLENCEDCLRLEQEWNPYVLELPGEYVEAAVRMHVDLQVTIINVIHADAVWFAARVHEIVHGHRRTVYG
jgi:hypothetical protein